MTRRVLIVCLGNICRSPTAEAVLRAMAEECGLDLEVDSAGTSGWHVGDRPYGPAIEEGARRGYDLTPIRARGFGPGDFGAFDLILGMDSQNVADIEAMRPAGNATPVALFTSALPGPARAVPDPYYTRDFEGAFELIEASARALLDQLQNASAVSPKAL